MLNTYENILKFYIIPACLFVKKNIFVEVYWRKYYLYYKTTPRCKDVLLWQLLKQYTYTLIYKNLPKLKSNFSLLLFVNQKKNY